ncbi:MAG: alpha-hydroxy acid oxidase [Comamonas sp.]
MKHLVSIADMRERARRRLPRSVFSFIDGGSEDELTLARNRRAFEEIELWPRVLTDVSAPDTATTLTGSQLATPFVIAPMGSCALGQPGADFMLAKAAADIGAIYTLSTMSTAAMEDIAVYTAAPKWFQLYVLKDHDFNLRLVRKAQALGYSALVVTVDLQAGGKREKDLKHGVSVPPRPSLQLLMDGITHPGWSLRMLRSGMPQFANVKGALGDESAGITIAARVGQNLDAAFTWDGLRRLREAWAGPLWLKGVLHPEDAKMALSEGVNGLWVSNHGGRQLDGAVASAIALPLVRQAVGPEAPIILDSGVRRGVDALKARTLGANAVAIGRAALWGACAGGQAGANRSLEILHSELLLAMQLAGVPNWNQLQAIPAPGGDVG